LLQVIWFRTGLEVLDQQMKIMRAIFLGFMAVLLTGCELVNLVPGKTVSRTDVASIQKGGGSAEVAISFFSITLREEAEGKKALGGGTWEEYWTSRMEHVALTESKEYYERVFRDFNEARGLSLPEIPVPSYESWRVAAEATESRSEDAVKSPRPEPSEEAKIVLLEAGEVQTRRQSFAYTFVVKEKLKGELRERLSIRLYQGSDVDDRGRDSHVRLAEFFLLKPSTNGVAIGEGRPLLAQNTNAVSLKVFGTVWLLEDENGKAVAVDVDTNGREWKSKGISEQFGAGKGKQADQLERNGAKRE
jgi:hypothetical protein